MIDKKIPASLEKTINKQSLRSEFKNLIWNIRRAVMDNRAHVIMHTNHKFNAKIIKRIYDMGVIEGWERRGKYIFIKLRSTFITGHQGNFTHLSADGIGHLPKPRHGGVSYTAKRIQKYQRTGGHHKVGFFNTDKGVVESAEAASAQIGGLPLFEVK